LYAYGQRRIGFYGEQRRYAVKVVPDPALPAGSVPAEVLQVTMPPLQRRGGRGPLSYTVRNIGGVEGEVRIPVKVDGRLITTSNVRIQPGDKISASISADVLGSGHGMHQAQVMDKKVAFKVYADPLSSVLLDLSADGIKRDGVVVDGSGFGNRARIIGGLGEGSLVSGKDTYVEVDHAPSVDNLGETLTMVVKVYPIAPGEGLMDVFSKGDNHVLQISGNRDLTFFAGGWGRGDCTVALPDNWYGHWHTIAGVCLGEKLKVYIDGVLKGSADVDGRPNLTVESKWVLGRNEEFPGQRAFNGYIDKAKVFAEPLTDGQIATLSK